MMQLLYGTVQAVFPPGVPQNVNGYQYEYYVLAVGDNYAQVPLHHVLVSDEFGAFDEFNDRVLEKNQKVLVAVLRDYSMPVIVGAIRNSRTITSAALGHHWTRRFNKVNTSIDKDSNWSVKSDSGPSAQVNTDSVVLDDSSGEKIVLDRVNKIMTIEANRWTVIVNGDASIKAQGNVTVEAGGNADVKAENVTLAGEDGGVLTTATQPTCYVTGIPFKGSGKVKAGS
jgi:hypothetical protein